MDEQEFKRWLLVSGLIWLTAILGIVASVQLSAYPEIQLLVNCSVALLIAPEFLHMFAILLYESPLIYRFLGQPFLWIAIFSLRIACLLDSIYKIIPMNVFSAHWRYRRMDLAIMLKDATKQLTAERILRELVAGIEKDDHNGFVLLRSMQIQGEIYESLDFKNEAEKIWLKTLDYLAGVDDLCRFDLGFPHELRLGNLNSKGVILTNLGRLYTRQGRYDEAIDHLKRAAWAIKADDSEPEDTQAINLGSALLLQIVAHRLSGSYRDMLAPAVEFHDMQVELCKDKPKDTDYLYSLWMLADTHTWLSHSEQAQSLLTQAEELAKSIHDTTNGAPPDVVHAGILQTKGRLLSLQGHKIEAKTALEAAVEARKQTDDSLFFYYADIYLDLAHVCNELELVDETELNYLRAIDSAEWNSDRGFAHPSISSMSREYIEFCNKHDKNELCSFFRTRADKIDLYKNQHIEPSRAHNALFWNEFPDQNGLVLSTIVVWLCALFLLQEQVQQYPLVALTASLLVFLLIAPSLIYTVSTTFLEALNAAFPSNNLVPPLARMSLQTACTIEKLLKSIPNNPYSQGWLMHTYSLGVLLATAGKPNRRRIAKVIKELGTNTTGEPIVFIGMRSQLVDTLLTCGAYEDADELATQTLSRLNLRGNLTAKESISMDMSLYFLHFARIDSATTYARVSMTVLDEETVQSPLLDVYTYIEDTVNLRVRRTKANPCFAQVYRNLSQAFTDIGESKLALGTAKKALATADASTPAVESSLRLSIEERLQACSQNETN